MRIGGSVVAGICMTTSCRGAGARSARHPHRVASALDGDRDHRLIIVRAQAAEGNRMANNSDGSAVYEVKVGEDDYIDGLDVTESDGSITTYLFRPANYDEVEAARKRAESAASLAISAAGTAKTRHMTPTPPPELPERPPRSARLPPRTPTPPFRRRMPRTIPQAPRLRWRAMRPPRPTARRLMPRPPRTRRCRSRTRRRRAPAANPISRSCAVRTASSRRCSPTRRGSSSTWTGPSTARHPRRRCPGDTVSFGGTCSVSGSTVTLA